MFTIVDNLVETIAGCVQTFSKRKICANFFVAFVMVCITCGVGIIHTTTVSTEFADSNYHPV